MLAVYLYLLSPYVVFWLTTTSWMQHSYHVNGLDYVNSSHSGFLTYDESIHNSEVMLERYVVAEYIFMLGGFFGLNLVWSLFKLSPPGKSLIFWWVAKRRLIKRWRRAYDKTHKAVSF